MQMKNVIRYFVSDINILIKYINYFLLRNKRTYKLLLASSSNVCAILDYMFCKNDKIPCLRTWIYQ